MASLMDNPETRAKAEISIALQPFDFYGLDVYIPGAVKAIMATIHRYYVLKEVAE